MGKWLVVHRKMPFWTIFTLLFLLQVSATIGDIVAVDVLDDLGSGWVNECVAGYHEKEDFLCNSEFVIPSDDYEGEIGFWAKCPGEGVVSCTLIYSPPAENFTEVTVTGYFSGNSGIELVIQTIEGYRTEFLTGFKWETKFIDLSSYQNIIDISFRPEHHQTGFSVIDKISIEDKAIPTTTTDSPTSTDFETTTDDITIGTTDDNTTGTTDENTTGTTDDNTTGTTDENTTGTTDENTTGTTDENTTGTTDDNTTGTTDENTTGTTEANTTGTEDSSTTEKEDTTGTDGNTSNPTTGTTDDNTSSPTARTTEDGTSNPTTGENSNPTNPTLIPTSKIPPTESPSTSTTDLTSSESSTPTSSTRTSSIYTVTGTISTTIKSTTTDDGTSDTISPIPDTTTSTLPVADGEHSKNKYFVPLLITVVTLLILLALLQCCVACFRTANKKKKNEEKANEYGENTPYQRFHNEPNGIVNGNSPYQPNYFEITSTEPATTQIAYNFNPKPTQVFVAQYPTSPSSLIEPIYSRVDRSSRSSVYGYGMDPDQEYFPRLARRNYTYGIPPV